MPKGKYQDWISGDGLLQIETWAREGLTDEQIAHNIGISKDTYYRWIKRFPDFSDTLKKGRKPLALEIENALIKRAKGFTEIEVTEEMTISPDQKKTKHRREVHKVFPPDTGAAIFLLKNRMRNIYSEKPVTDDEREQMRLNNERVQKELEMKDLQIEMLKRQLEEANPEIAKVDLLLEGLDNAAIEDAE